jgi:hypothetical protein
MKSLFTVIAIFLGVYGCTKTTVDTSTPLAKYTLGSGGVCTGATVSGRYVADTALDATNTVTVMVDVSFAGPYSITTNTVNGISFSSTDKFNSTGTQTVVLMGSGAPSAVDTSSFTLTPLNGAGGSCTFSVGTVPGIQPHYLLSCFLNGVFRNFGDSAFATNSGVPGTSGSSGLDISGLDSVINSKSKIDFGVGGTTGIGTGTYTNTNTSNAYFNYVDSLQTWTADSLSNTSFTINVTIASPHYVQGTFNGTIRSQQGTGTDSITVTNGIFTVPVR